MKTAGLLMAFFLTCPAFAEQKFGWVDGVKDVDQYLSSKDGNWTITQIGEFSTQEGGKDHHAKGEEKLIEPVGPNFIDVPPYTYYCANLSGAVDAKAKTFISIDSVEVVDPLRCLNDKGLDLPLATEDERLVRDEECFVQYMDNAGSCNGEFQNDDAGFEACLRPVKIHAFRCCKQGTPACAEGIAPL